MQKTLRMSVISAVLSLTLGSAQAGIFDDDEARKAILDLRAKVEALTNRLETKLDTKADKTALIDMANENQALRDEVARLRGQIEVLTNDLTTLQKRQKDFYVDLDNRLRNLEPKRLTVDGKEATVDSNEQRGFDKAMDLFKAADYKNAANAFNAFLSAYPQSAYAGSAMYWMGNSHYAQRDCKSMIPIMQQMAKAYPDHPKAPEALLNIAGCHLELKDKVAAKRVLQSVIANYPGTEAAQAAKDRSAGIK